MSPCRTTPSIEWNGSTRSVSELLENAVTADLYYEVLGAYYDAYGAQAGEIYIKLIQTRRELARAAGLRQLRRLCL